MAALQWQRKNSYYSETTCGRYRISAAKVNQELVYLAWQKTRQNWEPMQSGTLAHAREQCEKHNAATD